MIHDSVIAAIVRQNLYENVQRKINTDGERGLTLTGIVMLVCILSQITWLNVMFVIKWVYFTFM